MKKNFKFVFLGAGSSVFTLKLIGDILAEPCIESGHLALVDIDSEVLDIAEEAVAKFIRHTGRAFTYSKHTDFREALPGTDYIFFTIATGKYERWKDDIRICTKYGVNQSVGDTIGPGGIIRTLRTIPVLVDVAKEMERVCPDAWIINYTNPEGAVCLALQQYTKIKNFGLCHGTPDTAHWLARNVFKVEPERLKFRAAGINHLTWFTDLSIDGQDVYPLLDKALTESGMDKAEPISTQLFRLYGRYPAPGDRHVGEFFSFFMKDQVLKDQDYTWKNNDFIAVDQWREDSQKLLDDMRFKDEGYDKFLAGSGETATHFIHALATGDVRSEMVNVINKGYIPNISDGIIVEVPTFIDNFGLHPETVDSLPGGIAYLCESLGKEYLLAVKAAMECDYKLALQAMYLDPLARLCNYPEQLLKELIEANLDVLPEKWQEVMKEIG